MNRIETGVLALRSVQLLAMNNCCSRQSHATAGSPSQISQTALVIVIDRYRRSRSPGLNGVAFHAIWTRRLGKWDKVEKGLAANSAAETESNLHKDGQGNPSAGREEHSSLTSMRQRGGQWKIASIGPCRERPTDGKTESGP